MEKKTATSKSEKTKTGIKKSNAEMGTYPFKGTFDYAIFKKIMIVVLWVSRRAKDGGVLTIEELQDAFCADKNIEKKRVSKKEIKYIVKQMYYNGILTELIDSVSDKISYEFTK
jgi:hypothetical protein